MKTVHHDHAALGRGLRHHAHQRGDFSPPNAARRPVVLSPPPREGPAPAPALLPCARCRGCQPSRCPWGFHDAMARQARQDQGRGGVAAHFTVAARRCRIRVPRVRVVALAGSCRVSISRARAIFAPRAGQAPGARPHAAVHQPSAQYRAGAPASLTRPRHRPGKLCTICQVTSLGPPTRRAASPWSPAHPPSAAAPASGASVPRIRPICSASASRCGRSRFCGLVCGPACACGAAQRGSEGQGVGDGHVDRPGQHAGAKWVSM